MPISWPDLLVDALVRRDCVLFIGAGFTRNATSPKDTIKPVGWTDLLDHLLSDISPVSAQSRRRTRAGSTIATQIRSGDLLWAAQALESEFDNVGRHADFRNKIAIAVDGPPDARFRPGPPHQALLSFDAQTIVTTNYDKVLERLFNGGYVVLTYKDENIGETLRTGKPLLLKLHGTTDDPNGLILTRLDFARLRSDGHHALSIMGALIATRTVLFLGYGLNDPDLTLLLENEFAGARKGQAGHYLLASAREATPALRKVFAEAFGVEVISYAGDASTGFAAALNELEGVVASRATQ